MGVNYSKVQRVLCTFSKMLPGQMFPNPSQVLQGCIRTLTQPRIKEHTADLPKLKKKIMLLYYLILQSDFPEINIFILYKTNAYQNPEIHIERITLSNLQTYSDFINYSNFVLYN